MALIHSITILELGDDGIFRRIYDRSFEGEIHMRADRSAQKAASASSGAAQGAASGYGTAASGISGSIIPTLTRQAQGGQGFTPMEKSNMLTQGAEAAGGVNAGLKGAADLATARTKNAGGFGAALDEAARQKMRQIAGVTQNVNIGDAEQAARNQQAALANLSKIYGTDVSAQLGEGNLANQEQRTGLEAGNQGWLQNTLNTIKTIGSLGRG
jgi:hypothetical protein